MVGGVRVVVTEVSLRLNIEQARQSKGSAQRDHATKTCTANSEFLASQQAPSEPRGNKSWLPIMHSSSSILEQSTSSIPTKLPASNKHGLNSAQANSSHPLPSSQAPALPHAQRQRHRPATTPNSPLPSPHRSTLRPLGAQSPCPHTTSTLRRSDDLLTRPACSHA